MLDHRRLDISIEPQIIDQGMLERLQTPDKKNPHFRLHAVHEVSYRGLRNGASKEASRCQIRQYNITAGVTHSWRQIEPKLEDMQRFWDYSCSQANVCHGQVCTWDLPLKAVQCFELDTRSFNSSVIAWWQHLYCSCKAEKSFGKLNGSTSSKSVNELLFRIALSKDNIIWLKDP